MAYLRKVPDCKNWIACFRDCNGALRNRSTRMADTGTPRERSENRRKAMEIAFHFETVARGETLTESQLRKTVHELAEIATGKKVKSITISKYLLAWLDRMEKQKSSTTYQRYRQTTLDFLEYLGDVRGAAPLDTLQVEEMQGFVDYELAAGKVPKTVSVTLKTLRVPLNVALRQGLILQNPATVVEMPLVVSEEREVFSIEQVRALVAATGDPDLKLTSDPRDWGTAVLLAFYLGARLGDAVNMSWASIDLQKGLITYIPQKTRRRKRALVLPIHPALEKHLLGLPASDDPGAMLCPTLKDKENGDRAWLAKQFAKVMHVAGIDSRLGEKKTGKGKRFNKLTFHSLRHSFNSYLANQGVSQEIRQKLTGHTSAAMNKVYTHLEIAPLRQAVDLLPEV